MTEQERAACLEKGERLFNMGKFFEAHEIWEEVWKESAGPKKRVLQGLIQAAAGFHKLDRRVPGGAAILLRRAAEKLEKTEMQDFGAALLKAARQIESGKPIEPLPKITLFRK